MNTISKNNKISFYAATKNKTFNTHLRTGIKRQITIVTKQFGTMYFAAKLILEKTIAKYDGIKKAATQVYAKHEDIYCIAIVLHA